MNLIVAVTAKPQEVVVGIVAALTAEGDVVRVYAGAAFTDPARLTSVLEPEAPEQLRIPNSC